MERDYNEDVEVDFFNLHENWKEQGAAYMYWSEKWANAIFDRDKRAEFLDQDIRDNPTFYGIPAGKSVSEAAVTNLISTDSEYIELTREINLYNSAKKALEHRRSALDGLTKLFEVGYFASNDIPVKLREALKTERSKEVKEAQAKALNKPEVKQKLKR